jgi:hypothetical protein
VQVTPDYVLGVRGFDLESVESELNSTLKWVLTMGGSHHVTHMSIVRTLIRDAVQEFLG